MSRPIYRHWVAQCRYEGHEAFLFGTFQAESELQAFREAEAAWASIVPYPPPAFVMLPGLLAFHAEEL